MDQASNLAGLINLLPEFSLLATAAACLFVHLFLKRKGASVAGIVALVGLTLGLGIVILGPRDAGAVFVGSLAADPLAFYFKAIVILSGLLSILLAVKFFAAERSEPGEVYYLLPLSLIGMTAAVSSVDLVSTYVAFELFAIPSYILAGIFKKERRSAEAGIKYFFLGTLSSGIMLLGMALVFGVTGETNYAPIARFLATANEQIALTGMILFLAGLFFKAALAPFHMWVPDVYEGAPTPIVVFLSTASKAAVFAIIIRLIITVFPRFEAQWSQIFQLIALVTMFWGNLAALGQKNIKRMMAYSSIAQAGYIAIGLAAWSPLAHMAVLFYLFIYLFMNAAAFGMILLIRGESGFGETISDMRGLARRSPPAAASILVVLLSLTGIPPTAGFMGKYFLFASAVEKGLIWLAAAGAVNSVISLFYYFRIGRAIFMEEASPDVTVDSSVPVGAVLAVSAFALLVLGLWPSLLTSLAAAAGFVK